MNIYHFVSDTYREQAGLERSQLDTDLEFLHSAVEKIERICEDLGSVGPVIAQQVEADAATKGMRTYRKTRERSPEWAALSLTSATRLLR